MRTEVLGKRSFAFELEWNDNFGDDAKDALRDAHGDAAGVLYTVLKGRNEAEMLGSGVIEHKAKSKIFSYAEALSAAGRDGIYVSRSAVDALWYVVIADGRVVAGTDRSLREDDARDAILTLHQAFPELPILSCGVELHHPNVLEFTLEAAVAQSKVKPMKRLSTENPVVGVLVLAAVLGAVGYGGWYLFVREEVVEVDPAAEIERQRVLYVSQVQANVSAVPRDAAWAVAAYDLARTSFPEAIAGWSLEGVTCQPTHCVATYALARDVQGYALSPVWNAFGRDTVALMADKRSLQVTYKLLAPQMLAYTELDVATPPRTGARVMDTIGRLGMLFDSVAVDGEFKTDPLHESLQGPVGSAPLFRESFALKQDEPLTEIRLKGLVSYLSYAQFVATAFSFSTGSGSIPAAWRVEWVRVHGGEA